MAPNNMIADEVIALARELHANPDDLDKLITFESGWDPKAANPYSSAKGLIQFIDSTARDLGYRDSLDLIQQHPTAIDQLRGPVRDYLRRYAPFPDKQSLYLSVFYPAARTWPMDREFPPQVQESNPGIKTPRDYIAKVERIALSKKKTIGIGAILAVMGALYILTKKR